MDVFQRPDSPFWFASLDTPNGRRKVSLKPLLSRGPGAAKRNIALRAAQEAQDKCDAKGGSLTLLECLNAYQRKLEAAGKPSAGNVSILRDKLLGLRRIVRRGHDAKPAAWHLDPGMPVADLTGDHMDALVAARTAEGNAPQTIKHEIAMLRAAVKLSKGTLPEVIVKQAWSIPEVSQKTRWLTPEEWQRVYAELDPDRPIVRRRRASGKAYPAYVTTDPHQRSQMLDAQDLLVGLTMCGGRWSEVAGLTWDKVDLEAGTAWLWGNKTGHERLVPLPSQFMDVLRRRKATATSALVFGGLDGCQRARPSQALRKAIERAGLNSDPVIKARHGTATIHSLRHTFASWLLQRGATIVEVQDSLGHSNINMTRRYAALEKVSTAKRMGDILSSMPGADHNI